ncbi:uncharacterized protein LOC122370766 [Amphibalanus amphitrite]|uniref:uncharacterized protein LOC122370766 n=1 Tax=Amphibalanus amphitrite TaxID=1232801 RepID=UPI001C91B745|nr:uncharacterized protein LOC122370766 [Amphibalanus amphitrite]
MGRGDPRERSRQRTTTRVGSLGVLGPANDSGGDLASLDLESALDQTSDQSTDDSTVLETGVDGPTVRRQLQSLETMYSEVLRLLGGQKRAQPGRPTARVPAGRLRPGSSVSSLPSSIGGKPSRDRRREDRKQTRDSRGINKRFQRLESHVVTLARSVAHLSSEMRTQHLMFQEMESIRTELAQLRQGSGPGVRHGGDFGTFRPAGVSLTHPPRVRKLTRFFGDEPPLLRIFLNQLGYEKYAPLFERERIGMLELPYMTEERLQKLGVPIGPRLRILHEAQLSMRGDNPNVYIL